MKKLLILASLATAFAPPVMAGQSAANAQPVRSQVVPYSDIDLATAKGAAEFNRRVRVATESVCGTASDFDLAGQNDVRRCIVENKQRAALETRNAIARGNLESSIRIADSR